MVDSLAQLVPDSSEHVADKTTPLLHLNLSMATGSFLTFQFLQSSPPVSVGSPAGCPPRLTEILAHRSLLTLYASGVELHLLVRSSGEVVQATQDQALPTRINSLKLSAEVKCPVVQANVSALVNAELDVAKLPGLVPGQQQLDFSLTAPPTSVGAARVVVCDLLEAGVKDASLSFATSVLHSETSSDPILTWESLQTAAPRDPQASASAKGEDMKKNRMYMNCQVPVLWGQLASPPCGLPDPMAGGLDILLLQDAVKAWQVPVHSLKEKVMAMLCNKEKRDKQVMLTLVSNAIQNPALLDKTFNPVLAELSIQYRDSVVYCCLYQTWRALPVFSEIHVPTISTSLEGRKEADNQLMALILALATRIQFVAEEPVCVKPSSPVPPAKDADQSSVGTGGYISISPSPSDMALPNRLYANKMFLEREPDLSMFSQLDYETLSVLRESLAPLFSAVGVAMEPQSSLNKAEFVVDFDLQLREATLFVLDHIADESMMSSTPAYSTTPVLLAEQLFINGSIKHSSVQEAAACVEQRPLLLSPPATSELTSSQYTVLSNSCASLHTIHMIVTAPLLKLAKHVSTTGKMRRKAMRQAQLNRLDEMETPCPPVLTVEGVASDGGYVGRLASSVVTHLTSLQEGDPLPHNIVVFGATPRSTPSNIRLVDYADSPTPTRHKTLSLPAATGATKGSLLSVPVASPPVLSAQYSSSEEEVPHAAVEMEDVPGGTSPEDVLSTMDTCGEDTTDSQHVISSDNEGISFLSSHKPSSQQSPGMQSPLPTETAEHMSVLRGLSLPESQLQFSVFGMLKLHAFKCELQVESTRAVLELLGISAAVDTRNSSTSQPVSAPLPLLSEVLPTYVSVAAILEKSVIRVNDRGLPESDILLVTALPIYTSTGISNYPPLSPNYRCLLKLISLQIDIKQSAIKIHKRFQQLMPAFTKIYHDIFGNEAKVVSESSFATSTPTPTVQPVLSVESVFKWPAKLPQGFVDFSLDKTVVYVAPLPSLSVTYTVSLFPPSDLCVCVYLCVCVCVGDSCWSEGTNLSDHQLPAPDW